MYDKALSNFVSETNIVCNVCFLTLALPLICLCTFSCKASFCFPFSYTDLFKTISKTTAPNLNLVALFWTWILLVWGRGRAQIQCRPYQPLGRQQRMAVIFTFTDQC